MRVHIVLWKWSQPNERTTYTAHHVNVMAAMLKRNNKLGARVICITDRADGISECETFPLWDDAGHLANATKPNLPSCYRRLKLYDLETQRSLGIEKGDRIVGIDLDSIVCGNIDGILQTEGRYVGWGLKGTHHLNVFNGSFQMFTSGDLQEIWTSFDPDTSPKECFRKGWLGSDQSWLSMNLVGQPGSVALKWPEVASYPLQVRLMGVHSAKTRIMFFHGSIKPWTPQALKDTPFINRYWRL
jgi:hypothetical protein